MNKNLVPLSVVAALLAGMAHADVPRVATDIAPVHSLVARVMQDVGAPSLIVPPGASPHEYSLRPSEAKALQDANLVFWISPDLTPWLEGAIGTLASGASVTELLEVDGVMVLPLREGALFEAHAHEHESHTEKHVGNRHQDHDKHAGEGQNDHEHGEHDPHAWLSPDNASVWLNAIAAALSAADPDNAGTYYANAAAGRDELDALTTEIEAVLEPVRGRNFIVFHDAYQYFETAFKFPASGAISVSDASDPSPARIAEIQTRVKQQEISCVLSEPQFDPGIVSAIMEGSEARTGVLDPLGSDLEPGPALYSQILRNLATTLANCL